MSAPGQRCPHANIIHCPLYVASHGLGFRLPTGFVPPYGCGWGNLEEGCAVARADITYEREVARLCEHLDGAALVFELIGKEREDETRDQRARNMRSAPASDDWLLRQLDEAQRAVAGWPEWMKRVAYMEGREHW